eukprot:COSAG06_NODE_10662_length_1638_cov_1.953926_2_plen_118_part_00
MRAVLTEVKHILHHGGPFPIRRAPEFSRHSEGYDTRVRETVAAYAIDQHTMEMLKLSLARQRLTLVRCARQLTPDGDVIGAVCAALPPLVPYAVFLRAQVEAEIIEGVPPELELEHL